MEDKRIWIFKDDCGDQYAYTTEEKAYESALLTLGFPSIPAKDLAKWAWQTEVSDMIDQWLENYHAVVFSIILDE